MRAPYRSLLCIMLIIASLYICALPGTAAAEQEGTWGDLTWTLTDDGIMTVSGNGDIPDFSFETPNAWQFDVAEKVKTLIISDGVTGIGNYCFYGFKRLTEISLPETVTRIGSYSFAFCDGLTDVDLPGSAETIGPGTFHGCSSLETIWINDGLRMIGKDSFTECESLRLIRIPHSVKQIEAGAFDDTLPNDCSVIILQNKYAERFFSDNRYPFAAYDPYGILGFSFVAEGTDWAPVLHALPDSDSPLLDPDPCETGELLFFASGWEGEWLQVLRSGDRVAVGYARRDEVGDLPVPHAERVYESITVQVPWDYELYTDLSNTDNSRMILPEGTPVTLLSRDICWVNGSSSIESWSGSRDYVETVIDGRTVRGWLGLTDWDWWDRRWPAGVYLEDNVEFDHHVFINGGEYINYCDGLSRFLMFAQIHTNMIIINTDYYNLTNQDSFQRYTWEFSSDDTLVTLTNADTGEQRVWHVIEFDNTPMVQ